MEYVLKTNSLTKYFKKSCVVNKVNMHIRKGDIYGFIGENGAGKTTIIRLITGLAKLTSGDFDLFGVNCNSKEIRSAKERMSAIVETPSIYLNMTAYENLSMQLQLLGVTDSSIIDESLKMVGLEELKNSKKKSKNFSLGMKQRLGIAMALVGSPDFIILDEPMNGLDPEGIVEIRELIIKLNRDNNITFLISSHILDELSKVATIYGFIHKGHLMTEISADDLQKSCRKCIELSTSNLPKTLELFEEQLKAKSIKVLPNDVIRIYDDISINQIVSTLTSNDIEIIRINSKNENIEEFYLNMMGGVKNE